jgi:hypothetical protein
VKVIIAFTYSFLFLSIAQAGTLSLQLPVAHFNPICGYAPINQQTVTGFSADGAYVLVQAKGYTACGHSGHDGGISHVYWCDQLTFDFSGVLVGQSAIEPATYQGLLDCPWADPRAFFASAGYLADTTYNWNYTQTVPWLGTP